MKALSYSAQISGEEEEKLDDKEMALTITVSVLLAVLLFVVVPTGGHAAFTGPRSRACCLEPCRGVPASGHFSFYI